MKLQKKVAAIFAANGAIARAVAIEMAKEGAFVYVSGRNLEAIIDSINSVWCQYTRYCSECTRLTIHEIESI